MNTFAPFFALICANEGEGLDLTPSDPGNWTGGAVGQGALRGSKCGISAASFPTLDIGALTVDQIQFIYDARYLRPISYYSLPPATGLVAADIAVNQGVGAAAGILQASAGVKQDGVIGPASVAAAVAANDIDMAGELTARRNLRYAQLSTIATFGLGWFRRSIRTYEAARHQMPAA